MSYLFFGLVSFFTSMAMYATKSIILETARFVSKLL